MLESEQIAALARELRNSQDALENHIGDIIFEALHESRNVYHVVGRLNGRKGNFYELDQELDKIISMIREESPMLYDIWRISQGAHPIDGPYRDAQQARARALELNEQTGEKHRAVRHGSAEDTYLRKEAGY